MRTLIVLSLIGLIIANGTAVKDPDEIKDQHGALMKSFLNERVNPCTNFYKYACGNWIKQHRTGRKQYSFDVIDILTNKVNAFFKTVLLLGFNHSNLNENVIKVLATNEMKTIKDYYYRCKRQRINSYRPFINALNLPGGWPVTNTSWNGESFDWLNVTAQLKLLGAQSLFDATVAPHHLNVSYNTIYISAAEFPLFQPNNFLDEKNPLIELTLTEMIKDPFVSLGVSVNMIDDLVEDVLDFETRLAKMYPLDDEDDSDEIDDVANATFLNINEAIPEVDLRRFLEIVSDSSISESQQIIVLNPSYFRNLSQLLNETSVEIIANYLLYKFTLNIGTSLRKTEEFCINEIVINFGFALGPIYNMAFDDEQSNKDVRSIAENIKEVFKKTVMETEWIDEQTMKEAFVKLDNLLIHVGASNNTQAVENVIKEFSFLNFTSDNYHENYLKLHAYTTRKSFRKLQMMNKKSETDFNTVMVNAFYDSTKNHIIIPTNIMQSPVYDNNFPYSVKYGTLGSIVGHEITHSLDATGRAFDSQGEHRVWWSNESSTEYLNRAECLNDQYGNFTPVVMNVTMEKSQANTLDENIADNGGVRQSFRAYKNWLEQNPELANKDTLPHLNLTNIQLFFLSYAQFYCQMIKPVAVFVTVLTDEHSMNEYRVIGALTNFEEFSKAFQCQEGSEMNPAKKCKIW